VASLIADPEHVNALSSDQPLTLALEGLTITYRDNGTGKSGNARLLKRIAPPPQDGPTRVDSARPDSS